MIAGSPIPTLEREDNAVKRQPTNIAFADVTTGALVLQLFTPFPQNSIRHGNVARPL